MHEAIPTVAELRGLWRRSLISWPDGRADSTTRVRWLQGPRFYVDLRQAPEAPDFSGVRGLGQLSMDQCAWLATQEGFGGHFVHAADFFEWRHSIDFQPSSGIPDAGTLCWDNDVLVETGSHVPYIEHWHRDQDSSVGPSGGITLRELNTQLSGMLLRVGPAFMFARARAGKLPPGVKLTECVAGALGVREARAFVDCEISLGEVSGSGFRITASTLPYRVGDILGQSVDGDSIIRTSDRALNGAPLTRSWEITQGNGQVECLWVK
jgi:hypothetical protein